MPRERMVRGGAGIAEVAFLVDGAGYSNSLLISTVPTSHATACTPDTATGRSAAMVTGRAPAYAQTA